MKELDLHGIKHIEAERLIINIIEDNLRSGELIKFITGNSERMKAIVYKICEEYNLKTTSLLSTEIVADI